METVDVVFSGTVLPGFDPREAAASLAKMTGMSQDEALALLSSGKPRLAKRGLSPEDAQALTEKFAVMGVVAFVRTPGDAASSPSAPTAPEKAVPSPEGSESIPLAKPEPSLSTSALSLNKDLPDEDDEDFNPYTAPPADLSQTETPKKKGGHWRETCVVVPARQGGQWIEDARAMVKSATGVWIGAMRLFWIGGAILSGVLGSVFLGREEFELAGFIVVSLLLGLAGSFLAGGLALLAHRQTEQEAFEATDVSAVFQTCPGRMLQLAALELAYSFFACVFLLPRMETTATVLFVFLDFLLFLPLIPVLLCAPTLVAVAGQRPFQAIKQSFLCTCKNWRPVLVNSLILGAVPGLALLGSFSLLAASGTEGDAMVFFVLACLLFGLLCLSLSICLPAFILLPAMMMVRPVFDVLWMNVMMDVNTVVIFCVLACLFILLSLLYLPTFILLPAMSYRAVREMFYEEGKEEVSDATRVSCARKERMETVDVVFSGTVLPGFEPREAAASLAKMTGMSQDEALALLSSSKPRLARRGLSPEAAQALTEKFAVMGVVAFVRTPGDAASSPSAPTAPEKAVPSPEGSESIPLAKPEPSLSTSALSLNKDLLDEDDEDFNPYTAPPADLSQTGPPKKKGGHWRETCVVVPAARGIQWIKESWAMFKSAPVTWLGALLLSWFCMSALGIFCMSALGRLALPLGFLGPLAFLLCVPFFAGGLALLAHRQTEHEAFGAFDVFAAFYVCPNNMLFLGILGVACSILAGPFFHVAFSIVTDLEGGAMGLLAIFLPLIAALYMASTLVAVGGLYPPQSIWQGFLATCKNWRPILLNALILGGIPGSLALLIGLIHPLVTGKGAQEAATFLAAIQAFLIAILVVVSLLILLVMPAIIYRAVRDMFYEEGKEEVSDATRVS